MGFVQPAIGEEMPADLEQTSKSCEVFTPDITIIVAEMLKRKPSMSSFTLIFQDADENEPAKHTQNTNKATTLDISWSSKHRHIIKQTNDPTYLERK